MPKKFGIVIPVYKHWHLLDKCLESILSQSFQDSTIYVISDERNAFEDWGTKRFGAYPTVRFYEDYKHEGKAKNQILVAFSRIILCFHFVLVLLVI